MPDLPAGTVTFLFTDIEGSTRLWEQHPQAMREALARHDALLTAGILLHGGVVVKSRGEGDSFFAVFARATDAVAAAMTLQQALCAEPWLAEMPLRVRMALHTGEAELREGDYRGPAVNRCARLRAAAHGGQVLLSAATQELVRDHLPDQVSLRDLGEHRLKDLARAERVFQLAHPNLADDFPPLHTLDTHRNNLPAQPGPLIGREQELEIVRSLLGREGVRLVTLTGPGGTGKTRLGLQIASEILDDFPDGVFLVSLAPLTEPALVLSTIAQALSIRETGSRPLLASVKEFLQDRQILLLLDNFEHLLEAAPMVAELLAAAPPLKVLVTSRATLHLRGEHEFAVPPLALPDLKHLPPFQSLSQYAAVELFIQRAIAARPAFTVTNENAPAVAEICYRLDGLPLAIELAAARIKHFPPEALLTRLGNRLKLLTSGPRDLPARQQTLKSAIAWSYDLLDEEERKLFRRLSVFVGGCTLEAADAVGNIAGDLEIEALDGVLCLADKSLLRQEEGVGGEPRFGMLETIREYGLEQLAGAKGRRDPPEGWVDGPGEEATIRRQHAWFFFEYAGRKAADRGAWLDRQARELDNLRAALVWAEAAGEDEFMVRLWLRIQALWAVQGPRAEKLQSLEKALAAATGRGLLAEKADLLAELSDDAYRYGNFAAARSFDQQQLPIRLELGQPEGIAACYWHMGVVARGQADYEQARAFYERSLAIAREAGLQHWIAHNLNDLGCIAYFEGDRRAGRELLEQSLAISRESKDDFMIGATLMHLGHLAEIEGDYPQAERLLAESLAIWRAWDYKVYIAWTTLTQGRVALHRGDPGAARAHFRESLEVARDHGSRRNIASCLEAMAELAHVQQRKERAARLFGAATAMREAMGCPPPPVERARHDRCLGALRSALGEAAFTAAWSAGQALPLDQAINEALEQTNQT